MACASAKKVELLPGLRPRTPSPRRTARQSSKEVASTVISIYVEHELVKSLSSTGDEDYIGEAVNQREHALQQLSSESAIDYQTLCKLVISALLHDIGHLVQVENFSAKMLDTLTNTNLGVAGHEKIGAMYLREHGFPSPIPELVEGHVAAKRYLTYKNPEYYSKLSSASKRTLVLQGGPMSAEEARAFEADPLLALKLKVREFDEEGKVVGLQYGKVDLLEALRTRSLPANIVPDLESYIPLLESVLESA